MWVNASDSMIQDECDELTKKEILECAKVVMSEVEIVCSTWSISHVSLIRVLESYAVDDPTILDK